jgi:CP family cyanate transporter-like MFS transporter
MPERPNLPLWAGRTAALLGILLVALNLRTAVAALSPIISQISVDIPLSPVVIGIIGAAPPVTFAVSGLITPWITRKLTLEGAAVVAVLFLAVGHVARSLSFNAASLLIATLLTFIGVGIGNVLLPPLVKRYFPDRVGLVTTMYAALIAVSTALPALAAVPVATAFGWRASLGLWFVVALTALAPWIVVVLRQRRAAAQSSTGPDADDVVDSEPALEARLWRSPIAWAVMITFTVSSVNVYAAFAWLPSLLVSTAGVSAGGAGALLSLYAFMGFPASLLVPWLASRLRSVSVLIYAAVGCFVVGYLGLIFAPAAAPVVWIVFAGLGPSLFPLALVLINSRTRTHAGSVALSGFVQGIGYIIAAAGPLVFGLLHQTTGEWRAPLVFLLILSVAAIIPAIVLARPRYLEDDLRRR